MPREDSVGMGPISTTIDTGVRASLLSDWLVDLKKAGDDDHEHGRLD